MGGLKTKDGDPIGILVNRRYSDKIKMFPCHKKGGELVSRIDCEKCSDQCVVTSDSITNIPKHLLHKEQADVYNAFIPSRQYEDIKDSDRIYLWEYLCHLFKQNDSLLDLGCGTGRFAKYLQVNDFKGKYLGIDWAAYRIKMAQEYVPEYKFQVGDIFEKQIYKTFKDFDIVLLLEVIVQCYEEELILELFKNIPINKRVIFTEPIIYPFPRKQEYISLLDIDYMQRFDGIGRILFKGRKINATPKTEKK